MNINITERARRELAGLNLGEKRFLRLEILAGGCAGMTYGAGIDSHRNENDVVLYQDADFKVVADMKSALYIDGLQIDYADALIHSGFRFPILGLNFPADAGIVSPYKRPLEYIWNRWMLLAENQYIVSIRRGCEKLTRWQVKAPNRGQKYCRALICWRAN